jgi:hypothetical protein
MQIYWAEARSFNFSAGGEVNVVLFTCTTVIAAVTSRRAVLARVPTGWCGGGEFGYNGH